jgi:antitoxin (DNA-binding transcriptional repressor) of toxin-antitoxin stability system
MKVVDVEIAEACFDSLIESVEGGEEVVIRKGERWMARIVPIGDDSRAHDHGAADARRRSSSGAARPGRR